MKLGKLVIAEIAIMIIVLAAVLIFVEVTPYLGSSKQNESTPVYSQRPYVNGTMTLAAGGSSYTQFNYSTYDPAIMVIDLTFQNWQTPGLLTLYCNGKPIATIQASPSNPKVRFSVVSFSGWDWIKPPSVNAYTYGNEITFVSDPFDGFEGTFNYQIGIRGSR